MSIRAGDIAYIDDCRGRFQIKAKVLAKEKTVKGRRKRRAWEKAALLWGDVVKVRSISGRKAQVSAKGHLLEIPKARLTSKALLNMWQIDVGQGDATLIRFPDGKWAAIDLGPGRTGFINTNSGRTAVDFMAWMAFEDHGWMFQDRADKDKTFHFDWIAFTHPDEDHIGAAKQFVGKLGRYWSVGTVFHNGQGRFSGTPRTWTASRSGLSQLGPIKGESEDKLYLSNLIDGFADVRRYKDANGRRSWKLKGNWATILKGFEAQEGITVESLKRLSDQSDGSILSADPISIKVLGPVEDTIPTSGKVGLRYLDNNKTNGFYNLGGPSLTRNGHSLVMRLDYGDVKILMTGDLNFRSQALLLQRWDPGEFHCHVGKACHHGSEDISWKFLRAMSPIATVFSSGDQETHVHPRALVLGMSGAFAPRLKWNKPGKDGDVTTVVQEFDGHEEEVLFAPLLYSTELSRSVQMSAGYKAFSRSKDDDNKTVHTELLNSYIAKGDKGPFVRLGNTRIVENLTYGLVNIRTDGETVAIAVLEETAKNPSFHVETFRPSELEPID